MRKPLILEVFFVEKLRKTDKNLKKQYLLNFKIKKIYSKRLYNKKNNMTWINDFAWVALSFWSWYLGWNSGTIIAFIIWSSILFFIYVKVKELF